LIYEANDDSQEFVPEVATKWEYLNDTTIRFYLRDDITFSNGDKLTAEDVKFTLDLGNVSSKVHYFGQLDKTEVVDDYTIDVYTKTPNAALFSNFAEGRSSIISKKYYEEVGMTEYARKPIGSGPYVMAEWVSGNSITLKARDDYWGSKGATPTIYCTFVTEPANRSIELETGAVDIITTPDFNDLERLAGLGFKVMDNKSYLISQISVNHSKIPDVKVRQALAYAIDYPALVDAVYGNMATVADGLLPNLMIGYVKNWDVKYDPEKAKQLLAEAGYANGLDLEVLVVNLQESVELAEILQFYWRQIGINVRITQGAQAPIRERADSGDYQVYPNFSNWATGDPSRATSAHNGLKPEMYGYPDNVVRELADYWTRCVAEVDVPKRIELYKEFQEKIKEQWVFIPLAHKRLAYVISDKVEGFYPAPSGSPELWMVKVKK
jgi:peptide/nickel transport system substrate-binding protein